MKSLRNDLENLKQPEMHENFAFEPLKTKHVKDYLVVLRSNSAGLYFLRFIHVNNNVVFESSLMKNYYAFNLFNQITSMNVTKAIINITKMIEDKKLKRKRYE